MGLAPEDHRELSIGAQLAVLHVWSMDPLRCMLASARHPLQSAADGVTAITLAKIASQP
jgi:hypothetical protein